MNDLASRRGPCVLVVEDDSLLRDLIRSVLGQAGFDVIDASSGVEALRLIRVRHDICAVVSDISMPGAVNGFELARRIRKVHPRVGVVLVSGRTEPTSGELPYGVLFLSKPFRAVTLLRLLRSVVDRRLPEPLHSPD
jgi:CheY-like chemotaxis protein